MDVVSAWIDAYNARDADRLVELSDPGIVMHGAAGEQRGHEALRERIGGPSYGVTVTIRALSRVDRDDTVVVQTLTELRMGEAAEPSQVIRGEATFTVRDGRVSRMRVTSGSGEES